ncbi:MAG: PfkB family carbohydrate kinase, partial [Actinomycetota bacterium]|nr:PfkB family carbohydrate kinase [Actinomycetota bacterium]
NIRVSVDASSVTVIEQLSASHVQHLLSSLQPDVLFCTHSEAAAIGVTQHEHFGAATVVVKDGPRPVQVFGNDGTTSEFNVAAVDTVVDGTGAGDAFAAGYLLALARQATLGECVAQAQAIAARVVGRAGATLEDE